MYHSLVAEIYNVGCKSLCKRSHYQIGEAKVKQMEQVIEGNNNSYSNLS
jgi:hypothetical protein